MDGARRPASRDGGVAFAVWAPNARGVRVVGDFTGWGPHDGWPMRSMGASGVWELFVPGAAPGDRYKYRILGPDGALAGEGRPAGRARRGAAGDRVAWSTQSALRVDRRATGWPGGRQRRRTRSR